MVLLQGKRDAREDLWKALEGRIRGEPETAAPADDWAEFRAEEKRRMLFIDPYWRGATPDMPEPEPEEEPEWQIARNG